MVVRGNGGNIAQASNEQAAEIARITQGIEQVSQVVQSNSTMANETQGSFEIGWGALVMKGLER